MQIVPKDPTLLKIYLSYLAETPDCKIDLQKALFQPLRVLLRKL